MTRRADAAGLSAEPFVSPDTVAVLLEQASGLLQQGSWETAQAEAGRADGFVGLVPGSAFLGRFARLRTVRRTYSADQTAPPGLRAGSHGERTRNRGEVALAQPPDVLVVLAVP